MVEANPVDAQERFWLEDATLGDERVVVSCCVVESEYPRRLLVGEKLVEDAARYFFDTGHLAPGLTWVEETVVVERYLSEGE